MNLSKLGERSKLYVGLLVVWCTWCVWWLVHGTCTYSSVCSNYYSFEHLEERRITTLLAVMIPGMPMGFFVPAFIIDLVRNLGFGGFDAGYLGYVTEWLISVLSGFVQWFVLLPFVAKRIWRFVCKLFRPYDV